MEKKEFYIKLVEYLELEDVSLSEETEFRTLEGYDSLAKMSIIAFADEFFNIKLSGESIMKLTNVSSLMDLIGMEQFK